MRDLQVEVMSSSPTILWFRQDLRLADNLALQWAAARGSVIALYILEEDSDDPWPIGGAGRWWLNHALVDLQKGLKQIGVNLTLRRGDPLKVLRALSEQSGAKAVTWGRCYEPHAIARDKKIKAALEDEGLEVVSHNNALLFEPWEIKTGSGTPFKIYTPFSRACFAAVSQVPQPVVVPKKIEGVEGLESDDLSSWQLLPARPDWATGMRTFWQTTEQGAHKQLEQFIGHHLQQYKTGRDRPDQTSTSRLSPYLHWGQISPRQIWAAVQFALAKQPALGNNAEVYLKEILWREFSYHLLYHLPKLPEAPINQNFIEFPWRQDSVGLRAWQKGLTGYPIVDAGMRQLWQTGWMHNRVRMIVASFLIKDLLVPWQEGERWFWDTLVDADLASNAASWQWVAGCGADAAPYFRIFNPTLQGQKFDPDGAYVRQYVPELGNLESAFIHEPWRAPVELLAKAGVVLGQNYPKPIVDHGMARARALEALAKTKKT